MSVPAPDGEPLHWDALDAALTRLRECRNAADLAQHVGVLALEGCGAEAASFGTTNAGVWSPWCGAGRPELLEDVAADAEVGVAEGIRSHCRADGRRRVDVSIPVSEQASWLLRVVTPADVDLEIVASFGSALASTIALVAVLQRADEQRYVVARLVNGIGEVADQGVELVDPTPSSSARTRGEAAGAGPSPLRARLSPRQREVMDLMLRGLSNAEIAERLVVALPTVKSHVRAVLRASGAVNRSDAIARMARDAPTL